MAISFILQPTKTTLVFNPAPTGIQAFEKELSGYKQGKGSIQFPLDEPMPLELITNIVKHRIKQLAEKAAEKKIKKTKGK